ncbi:hypothetical protein D3C78_1212870 [compost metagenome]
MFLPQPGMIKHHSPNPYQQQDDANSGPDQQVPGRLIAHQIFCRPIVRIADITIRTLSYTSPGSPKEKSAHLTHSYRIFNGILRNGIVVPELIQLRILHKEPRIITIQVFNSLSAYGRDNNFSGFSIIGIFTKLELKPPFQTCLLLTGQRFIGNPVFRFRPAV